MCKILAFTDTKKLNLKKHVNKIGNTLLQLEEDGFGYAVKGEQGVFGEKTIANKFKSRLNATNLIQLPIFTPKHEVFGTQSANEGPGIFHGRTSTNVGGLVNTHPMQLQGWNLIHNGVVTDVAPDNDYDTVSDNDSEFVLYRLIQGIDRVQDSLEGYYAFAAIDPEGRLHVCRDSRATLFIAYSPVLDSNIIATTDDLLTDISKMIGAKIGPIEEIMPDLYMVFEGNKMIHSEEIKTIGVSWMQSRYSGRSLGREIMPYGEVIQRGVSTQTPMRNVGPSLPTSSEAHDDRTGNHHRPNGEMSEAEHKHFSSLVSTLVDGAPRTQDEEEEDWRRYQEELANMDGSYTIYMPDDRQIELYDYHKLDRITKQSCTICRADGTVVQPDYSNLKLRYGNEG